MKSGPEESPADGSPTALGPTGGLSPRALAVRRRAPWGRPGAAARGSGPRRAGTRPWPGPRSRSSGTLDPRRARQAIFPFTQAERLNWHYVPRRREGLPLKDMTADARAAAHALLQAGLSAAGYAKARDVMRLEGVLRQLETSALHARPRQLRGHDLRDAGRALGVAVRGPPPLAQLHGRPRPGHRGHPRVPRREPGGGAVGPPEGTARPPGRAGSRPGPRREPRSGASACARRSRPSRSVTS